MSNRGSHRLGRTRRSARLQRPQSMEVVNDTEGEGVVVDLTCDADDDIMYMEELPVGQLQEDNYDMPNLNGFEETRLPSLRRCRRGVNERPAVVLGSNQMHRSTRRLHSRRNPRRDESPTPYHVVDEDGFSFVFNWGDQEDMQERFGMNLTINIDDNNSAEISDFIDITNSPLTSASGEEHKRGVAGQAARAADSNLSFPQPSASAVDTIPSPEERHTINCPVCFDTEKQIRRSGKQIMSTICGHLFCSYCIQEVVRKNHQCPTCRRKLTLKQIHPIFL